MYLPTTRLTNRFNLWRLRVLSRCRHLPAKHRVTVAQHMRVVVMLSPRRGTSLNPEALKRVPAGWKVRVADDAAVVEERGESREHGRRARGVLCRLAVRGGVSAMFIACSMARAVALGGAARSGRPQVRRGLLN